MNVTVMSRSRAISYCHKTNASPSVMISISDPNMRYGTAPFMSRGNRIAEILRMTFADADAPGRDVYGREAEACDLMKPEDGEKVKAFLDKHPGADVIVHCDAGISRSAGVAAGILKAMTGDDSQIFDNPAYRPNMHCYRVTMAAMIPE